MNLNTKKKHIKSKYFRKFSSVGTQSTIWIIHKIECTNFLMKLRFAFFFCKQRTLFVDVVSLQFSEKWFVWMPYKKFIRYLENQINLFKNVFTKRKHHEHVFNIDLVASIQCCLFLFNFWFLSLDFIPNVGAEIVFHLMQKLN